MKVLTDVCCPLMLVDDDPAIREVISAVVEADGYSVVTADEGGEALRRLRAGLTPCLILLDLRMPGMDGRTFRETQMAETKFASIPVVILTGDSNGAKTAASLNAGLMVKPVDIDELLSMVARYCRRGHPAPS